MGLFGAARIADRNAELLKQRIVSSLSYFALSTEVLAADPDRFLLRFVIDCRLGWGFGKSPNRWLTRGKELSSQLYLRIPSMQPLLLTIGGRILEQSRLQPCFLLLPAFVPWPWLLAPNTGLVFGLIALNSNAALLRPFWGRERTAQLNWAGFDLELEGHPTVREFTCQYRLELRLL